MCTTLSGAVDCLFRALLSGLVRSTVGITLERHQFAPKRNETLGQGELLLVVAIAVIPSRSRLPLVYVVPNRALE